MAKKIWLTPEGKIVMNKYIEFLENNIWPHLLLMLTAIMFWISFSLTGSMIFLGVAMLTNLIQLFSVIIKWLEK